MSALGIALQSLKEHEGLRLKMYKCPAGYWTIGYGFNLEANSIPQYVADALLQEKAKESLADLESMPFWHWLSDRRKAALIDMHYCLGPSGFREFKKMRVALNTRDYPEAAEQVLDSEFAEQTGRRAINIANMLVEG